MFRRRRRALIGALLSGILCVGSLAATAREASSGAPAAAEWRAAAQPVVAAIPNDAGTRATLESRPCFVPQGLTPGAATLRPVAFVLSSRHTTVDATRSASPQPPTRRRYAKACHRDDGDPPA